MSSGRRACRVIVAKLRCARPASATHKTDDDRPDCERGGGQRGASETVPALPIARIVDDATLDRRLGLVLWRRCGDDHRYVLP